MKKLYLVLNISTALLSSNTTLLQKYLPKDVQIQKDESSKVFNVLEQFLTPRKPLNINYLGPEHKKLSAKTSIVTKVIKQTLKKIDPIFTDKCLSKISLGDTSMIPGKSVKVPFFYHLEHYEGSYIKMDIYIKEHVDASQQTTVKKIADKIKLELHLKNFCYQQRMDTPSVAQDIREALVGQHVLSAAEAQYVQPGHFLIFSGNKYRLRVIKGGLAAYSQFNLFIVNRHAKIIHWECNDNVLHFIAYFTPGDYIVLRKVMNAMPESYFLGTFIQILNDGEYDNAEADSNFRIPTVDKIKDYTTAYRHIFSWSNRLDEYMGHFGAWDDNERQTADNMVCVEKHGNRKVCDGAYVLRDWLKYWFRNHGEHQNNYGVMMNLKWTFVRGHMGWSRYRFAYWDSALW